MTPEDREHFEFKRIELVQRLERDWGMIQRYRDNEQFFIKQLMKTANRIGRLDERLGGHDDA